MVYDKAHAIPIYENVEAIPQTATWEQNNPDTVGQKRIERGYYGKRYYNPHRP